MRTVLVRPLGEGEPWFYRGHVQHVTKKRKLFWAWGKGGAIPLRKDLFDEINAHAGEAYVQPGHVGDHVRGRRGKRACAGLASREEREMGSGGRHAMRFIFVQRRVCLCLLASHSADMPVHEIGVLPFWGSPLSPRSDRRPFQNEPLRATEQATAPNILRHSLLHAKTLDRFRYARLRIFVHIMEQIKTNKVTVVLSLSCPILWAAKEQIVIMSAHTTQARHFA